MTRAILPGATIGVLGSGQLGRMFAISARRMGYRVHTLSPEEDTPTGHISDLEINASYDDLDAIRSLARGVDVVTFEFENVPAATAAAAAELVPVRPSGAILEIAQNRLREKTFLSTNGFPVTPFSRVTSHAEVRAVMETRGTPAILKTAAWGYDGKGQVSIDTADESELAWQKLSSPEAILEELVDFDREVSVVVGREGSGETRCFEVTENHHTNKILDYSVAPSSLPRKLKRKAIEVARGIATKLELEGVLCVEMFVTRSGDVLVNELAPRPHNSGHWTFDAALTSQFEQQVRAVCGLSLGSTDQLRPAAMANLLGDLWSDGDPDFEAACRYPEVKLHLYGKARARPGRKMGHLTAIADSPEEALSIALAARKAMGRG